MRTQRQWFGLACLCVMLAVGCGDGPVNPLDTQYIPAEQAYTQQGWNAVAAGDYLLATESFQNAIQADAEFAEAHSGLGWVALEQQNFEAASRAFELALSAQPDEPMALVGTASIAWISADYDQAVASGTRALELLQEEPSPETPLVLSVEALHQLLAQAYYALGEYEQSLEHLEQVGPQDLSPQDPNFIDDLLRAIERTETEGDA